MVGQFLRVSTRVAKSHDPLTTQSEARMNRSTTSGGKKTRKASASVSLSATTNPEMRMSTGYFWPLSVWKHVKGGAPDREHPRRRMTLHFTRSHCGASSCKRLTGFQSARSSECPGAQAQQQRICITVSRFFTTSSR